MQIQLLECTCSVGHLYHVSDDDLLSCSNFRNELRGILWPHRQLKALIYFPNFSIPVRIKLWLMGWRKIGSFKGRNIRVHIMFKKISEEDRNKIW